MIIQDFRAEIVPRELQPLTLVDSCWWYRLQSLIKIIFCNLALVALFPYFISDNLFPSQSSIINTESTVFWLTLVCINLVCLTVFVRRPFVPKRLEIACKQGIWKMTTTGSSSYASLAGDVLMWQWIILIKLYFPAKNSRIYLVILKDSISPQDWARLRRWLVSEFN